MASSLHPKLPKYVRLAEELRQQINDGDLKAGDRLPSFVEMRTQHGVSQGIMERAYVMLEEDHLVERQPGRGTFVAEPAKWSATGILGFIMHADMQDMATPYGMHLLTWLHREAASHDLQINWVNPQDENNLSREKMDAVLLHCNLTEALAINLPSNMPHALLFQHSPDFTCIVADDFEGGKLATQHLIDLGHQRIACLSASGSDSVSRQRVAGYHAALENSGISKGGERVRILQKLTHINCRKSGNLAMRDWLKEDRNLSGCTAIVAHNDETAIGVIQALVAVGFRVPEDVSVVGFDGTELSELCTPSLTTIKVPLEEIAKQAIKVLLEQMRKGAGSPTKVLLPVTLKTGQSVCAKEVATV